MFNSAVRFVVALLATFVTLTYMWVNAAHAAPLACNQHPSGGVWVCEGSALPMPPRGTVRHLPAASVEHRAAAALAAHRAATVGRVGVTEIVARLGR